MTDRTGQQLGNYRVIRLLGEGGFAEVYLGVHVYLGTRAALKVMRSLVSADDVENFRIEAATIANLVHPNIVRVLEFGVKEDDKTPFLVMDYAPNGSLRQLYPRGISLPLTTIVPYIRQIASALSCAHESKLVHRDVKPENMLLGRQNELLLSDFGLAVMSQSASYQGLQNIAGTITYIAPEQLQGRPVPASDQYSLGIVVYEWLSGDRPFQGTISEITAQHLTVPPQPLEERVPGIAPEVARVVIKALAKDPKDRFASVVDFATALEEASRNELEKATAGQSSPVQQVTPQAALPVSEVLPTLLPGTPEDALPPDDLPVRSPAKAPVSNPAPVAQPLPSVRVAPATPTVNTYRGHSAAVNGVTWSTDGRYFVSGSDDKTVRVWDSVSGQLPGTYSNHTGKVKAVLWIPDNSSSIAGRERRVFSGGEDTSIQAWVATSGSYLGAFKGHSGTVRAITCSPDGKLIASCDDKDVQLWLADTGQATFVYRGHIYPINCVVWSPDGTRIASAGGGKAIQVWEATTGRLFYAYQGHANNINGLAWSPDGKRIASVSDDKTLQIWDVVTGYNAYSARMLPAVANAVSWSGDGKRIATASTDGTLQLWDADIGRKLSSYRHSAPLRCVAWGPDTASAAPQSRLAFAGDDGAVFVWIAS